MTIVSSAFSILLITLLFSKSQAQFQKISCYKCDALCNDFHIYNCRSIEESERSEKCKKDISCCDGSNMQEVFGSKPEHVEAGCGKCISEFQMNGENVNSVHRRCGNGYNYKGKSIQDTPYGARYDENEDNCDDPKSNCNHGCWCDEDFCNTAQNVYDCYTRMTGLQTFMVVNAVVLGVLFIAVEVLFRLKKRKINQGIEQLKMTYDMKRSDYKKAKYGLGKTAAAPVIINEPPPVITDKNEIMPDFIKKVEPSSRSSVPEKFNLPVSIVTDSDFD